MAPLNPRLFPEATRLHLDEGIQVRYRLNARGALQSQSSGEGEGEVELIWLGLTEKVDIRRIDNGKLIRADLAFDEVKPVEE